MKKVKVVTIVLFSVSIIFAVLIGYNYFTTIHVISKQQVIDLATKYGQWSPQGLENYTVEADLLQAHLSNRVALEIDPTTMSANSYPKVDQLRPFNVKENQLFWEVTIKKYLSQYEFKDWIYEIDATNGTLIQSFTPIG